MTARRRSGSGVMPRWLQAWLALTLGVITAGALALGGAALSHAGEPAFSDEERAWLRDNVEGGKYLDSSTYQRCEYGVIVNYASSGRKYTYGGQCWK